MMNNNGFNNFNGYQQPGGYVGGGFMYQQPPKLHFTTSTTPEELKMLRKSGGFSLEVSKEDLIRSYCAHRSENDFTVAIDDEGNFTCSLCGTTFKPFEGTPEEAKAIINRALDVLETTKMRCISLPAETIRQVFQIEPILKQIPELYRQSVNDFKRVVGSTDTYYIGGQDTNSFNYYQNMINPMVGTNYYDTGSVYGSPAVGGQPIGYPQQQGYPQYPNQGGYPQPGYQQPVDFNMGGYPNQGGYPQQQGYPQYQNQGYNNQNQNNGNPFNLSNGAVTNNGNSDNGSKEVTVTKTLKD